MAQSASVGADQGIMRVELSAGLNGHHNKVHGYAAARVVKLFFAFVLRSAPQRHRSSKWFVSLEEYRWDMWPTYGRDIPVDALGTIRPCTHEAFQVS